MGKEEYPDQLIMAYRSKYREKQDSLSGMGGIVLHREELFGGICSIMLPETMSDMDSRERILRYRNRNRPEIIKSDRYSDAVMAFSMLSVPDGEKAMDVSERMRQLRRDMKRVWKQNVYYDLGEAMAGTAPVAWMDLKAFCLDGSLYSLMFIFMAGAQMVLGSFQCAFQEYGRWKQDVLKMLGTIQLQENE